MQEKENVCQNHNNAKDEIGAGQDEQVLVDPLFQVQLSKCGDVDQTGAEGTHGFCAVEVYSKHKIRASSNIPPSLGPFSGAKFDVSLPVSAPSMSKIEPFMNSSRNLFFLIEFKSGVGFFFLSEKK
ncbi:hypothetical protein ElyMa_001432300 [Elysia marginata]|uniref:Uncharacterized protein n=1 Tax=Elysia marginata TaxID=1093978 RepID=A0AAV4IWJ1_9GAST|nr:hypothetical protein ElyMa_001432300 [Elysia marginata]